VIKRLALIGAGIGLLFCSTILLFLWRYGILEWRIGGPHGLDLTLLLLAVECFINCCMATYDAWSPNCSHLGWN
jgi:hypothetical protein